MAKLPDYSTWTFEDLEAEADRRYQRLQELGLRQAEGGLSATELLEIGMERGEHRGHLDVIDPYRTEHMVREQRLRDPELHRLAGMSDEEFERHQAKLRALRQEIKVGEGPDAKTLEPGVTTNAGVSQ